MQLDHVNIVVRDLEAAKSFFRHFGYRAADEADLSGPWISEVVGLEGVEAHYAQLVSDQSPVRIELIRYDQPESPTETIRETAHRVGYRHVAFAVADIDREVARLAAAGVAFLSPVHTYARTGKRIVYGSGPEGILVELAQYPG